MQPRGPNLINSPMVSELGIGIPPVVDMVDSDGLVVLIGGMDIWLWGLSPAESSILLAIDGICITEVVIVALWSWWVALTSSVRPNPGPASSIYLGRHSTLPRPLARILSTQLGKAPVSKYRLKIVSDRSCVQSFRRIDTASLSACSSCSRSTVLAATSSNGRRREGAGRTMRGPRIASL